MQTILVVEHNEALADIIERTLTREGFVTELVGDGTSALDWLNEHTPISIISDIDLPGMNGYQLYQRVRRNPDWAAVRTRTERSLACSASSRRASEPPIHPSASQAQARISSA